MCGLVGICGNVNFDSFATVEKMIKLLTHRGPDNVNTYFDDKFPIHIGHSRLSIIDLSKQGSQPMKTFSNRFVIAYNGEIYNANELKKKILEKRNILFKGTSDTEILLYAFEVLGIENTLTFAKGMFSIFLYDNLNHKIYLMNDIFGEKPLYYSLQNNILMFSSELKSLKIIPNINLTLSKQASSLLFQRNYIPSPLSIYNEVNKIEAGTILVYDLNTKDSKIYFNRKIIYHNHANVFNKIKDDKFIGNYDSAKKKLKNILISSVEETMVADCSVGSFLSGGIDSSLITAILSQTNKSNIQTFSIGFDLPEYNEAVQAKKIANYLKTDHNEYYINKNDVLNIVEKIPDIYCEPFSDSSQIPTFYLSNLASKKVKVALTGDGGDEIFGGYNRYIRIAYLWKKIEKLPFSVRKIFINLLSLIPLKIWSAFYDFFIMISFSKFKIKYFTEKIQRLLNSLGSSSSQEFYLKFISHWDFDKEQLLTYDNKTINDVFTWFESDFFEHTMMAVDTLNYLPNDLLVKTDRAAMANSLETRMPFLHPDVYNFAWRIPINYKIKNGNGKMILKDILSDYMPLEYFNKPKMGFLIPISQWLKGDLKDWARDILNKKNFEKQNIIKYEFAIKSWENFLKGYPVSPYKIWDILIFQQWVNRNY